MDNEQKALAFLGASAGISAVTTIPDKGRNDLAFLFAHLGFTQGAEIGTEAGKYAFILCSYIPRLHLSCIDPWFDYDDGGGYKDSVDQERFDAYYGEARKRLAPFDVSFYRFFSSDAVKQFSDNSLDFVYIDGNHRLDYVCQDIINWTEKVKPGGIIAGHDYIKQRHQHSSHIPYALEAYRKAYRIPRMYVLDNKDKSKRSVDENKEYDRIRSWFFVKGVQ